jgi:phosphohistidine phosphatase SixA
LSRPRRGGLPFGRLSDPYMRHMRYFSPLRYLALVALLLVGSAAQATEAGWALLREGGHVVLLRHAQAPGQGDPARFDIEDCRTQRNLSERGRQQARRMGALFAARAEPVERVLTSRYCRCLDTAQLAFGDRDPEEFPALDLPTGDEAADAEARRAIIKVIADYTGSGNLVLVTHLEIINALTGQSAREAEALIVNSDGESVAVHGRIVFN